MSCPAKVCPSRKVSIQKWSKSIVFVLGFVQEYCKLYSQYFCRMSRQGSEQMKLSDSLTCREAQSRRKNEPQKTGRTIRLYRLYSIPMDSLEIQQSQLSVRRKSWGCLERAWPNRFSIATWQRHRLDLVRPVPKDDLRPLEGIGFPRGTPQSSISSSISRWHFPVASSYWGSPNLWKATNSSLKISEASSTHAAQRICRCFQVTLSTPFPWTWWPWWPCMGFIKKTI